MPGVGRAKIAAVFDLVCQAAEARLPSPSDTELAQWVGLSSPRNVRYALALLKEMGALEVCRLGASRRKFRILKGPAAGAETRVTVPIPVPRGRAS